ncbi:MAG: TPM domain-containing protein [Bacteroidota bacterium]|nr:TPM domain-containing protein [Bacteroidota bacterium]
MLFKTRAKNDLKHTDKAIMRTNNEDFKTKLYLAIESIEKNSSVEIVAMIKPQSDKYKDISFASGIIILFLTYSFFIYSPTVYNDYLIYFTTIFSFFITYGIVDFITPLKRLLLSKKRKKKNVEIYARAYFQKAKIRHTTEKTGILIYISILEKETFIIADKEVEISIPSEEWDRLNNNFNNIFTQKDFYSKIIENLNNCLTIFSEYIPSKEDDINELPDNMDIDL